MRKASCFTLLIAATWLIMLIAGCGGGSKAGDVVTPGANRIGQNGGTVSMNGVTLVASQGATDPELTVTPTLTWEDTPPAPAPAGAVVASKTLVVSGVDYNFYQPVKITMPYSSVNLGAGDLPAVFFYDSDSRSYGLVGVKEIDPAAKTVTFSTTHGGKYVAMGINGLAAELGLTTPAAANHSASRKVTAAAVDTGFAPANDGFFHPNFGAYDAPGGSCLGMANFSVWYYRVQKAANSGRNLYGMYKEGDVTRWEDDLTARELISRAFMASSQSWAQAWMQTDYKLDARSTGYFMILGLRLAGPMTFLMADQYPGMTSGHAAVVYKYGAGKFYIYDDNFPGEVVTIDWGADSSGTYRFANYSKNAAYNPPFTHFAFEGFSTFAESSQYRQLFDGAQAGWASGQSKFNSLAVTSALDSGNRTLNIAADGTIELTQQDSVAVRGTVAGGIRPAKYIVYRLNGGARQRVNVSGSQFTIQLPAITLGSNTLMMVATDDPYNEWSAYAGFKEVPVRIKGQYFFQNGGFESVTPFDKWLVETHTWGNTTPGSFTPRKAAIVTPGMDEFATTLNRVYIGNHSARVNSSDNDLHISSITQTAVVPSAANPQAKFYWAAVLEDPGHAPSEQPYVDVTVKDDRGVPLYSKHFYSNDPSYPGWLSFSGGNWKAIPWQTITLSFTRADAGKKITVTVTAADCSLGAHGGYVYLDGDE